VLSCRLLIVAFAHDREHDWHGASYAFLLLSSGC